MFQHFPIEPNAMQLPSVDRTANGPSFGAEPQPAAGGAGTAPRATRAETQALQERAAQAQIQAPEPSAKVQLSAEIEELIRIEKARADEERPAAVQAAGHGASKAPVALPSGAIDADLQKPGVQSATSLDAADEAQKVEAAKKAETPDAIAKYMATGQKPGPGEASPGAERTAKDWTEKPKTEKEKPPEPPKEPISKKLLDFLQSLWRAGGNAIDVAQNNNDLLNPPKESDGPLTYSDPSAKKTSGL